MASNATPPLPLGARCLADQGDVPNSWGYQCGDPAEHMVWVPYRQAWFPVCAYHWRRLPEEIRCVQPRTS